MNIYDLNKKLSPRTLTKLSFEETCSLFTKTSEKENIVKPTMNIIRGDILLKMNKESSEN